MSEKHGTDITGVEALRLAIRRDRGEFAPSRPLALCGTPDGTERRADAVGSLVVANGPVRHEHTLPSADGLREGAVAQCPGCGRYFVLDPIPWERIWRPVRWWDRKAKRAIREAHGG